MKRQHPIDPNLFWCPKCKTWGKFGKIKTANGNYCLRYICNGCRVRQEKQRKIKNPEKIRIIAKTSRDKPSAKKRAKEYKRKRYQENKSREMEKSKKWALSNPIARKKILKKSYQQRIDNIDDWYVKACIRNTTGLKTREMTDSMIDLKRQAITIKRIERSMINELAR